MREAIVPQFEKAELSGGSRPAGKHVDGELGTESIAVQEASGDAAKPAEMDGMDGRAELPGDWEGVQAPGREEQRSPT